MNKKIVPLILLCILLCGCQAKEKTPAISAPPPEPAPKTAQELLEEQIIDDTHDAFLVDTGGKLGTLMVTVEQYQDGYKGYGLFEIWDPHNMAQPIQREIKPLDFVGSHQTVDANFDGYGDFGYLRAYDEDDPTGWYSFWSWNETAKRFEEMDGFENLKLMWFDPDTKTVYGRLDGYFQWKNGKFTQYEE